MVPYVVLEPGGEDDREGLDPDKPTTLINKGDSGSEETIKSLGYLNSLLLMVTKTGLQDSLLSMASILM